MASSALTGDSLKLDFDSLVKGAVTAGVLSYANGLVDATNLGFEGTADVIAQTTIDTTIKTGLQTTINDGDFEETFLKNLGASVQAQIASEIGNNYLNNELNYFEHKGAHLLAGSLGALISGDSALSGALGALSGEVIGEEVAQTLVEDGNFTTNDKSLVKLSSSLGTILSSGLIGADIEYALRSSDIAVENNLILHAPGTFSKASDVDEDFKIALKEFYKDDQLEIIDNGRGLENNHDDRALLADKIVSRIIKEKVHNPNEPIYLTGHSHGGNVQKIVTQQLVQKGYTNIVDSIMYLGTPVFNKYKTNTKVLNSNSQIINVFDKDDLVQAYFSAFSSDEINLPRQTINNLRVRNIQVESPKTHFNEGFYLKYYGDHLNIDSPEVLKQVKEKLNVQ